MFKISTLLAGGPAAFPSAFARGGIISRLAATGALLFAAATHLVLGGPSPAFRFLFADAPFLITLFDMVGLAFLFARVTGFVPSRHMFVVVACLLPDLTTGPTGRTF
jgi:hypothetical protein